MRPVRQQRTEAEIVSLALQGHRAVQNRLQRCCRSSRDAHVMKQVRTDDVRDRTARSSPLNGTGECSNSFPDDSRMTVTRVPACNPMKERGKCAPGILRKWLKNCRRQIRQCISIVELYAFGPFAVSRQSKSSGMPKRQLCGGIAQPAQRSSSRPSKATYV
jgi:hypothetical protein